MPITTMSFRQTLPQTPDRASRPMARPRGAQPRQRRTGVSEYKTPSEKINSQEPGRSGGAVITPGSASTAVGTEPA